MNYQVQFEMPEEVAKSLHALPENIGDELRFWAAVSLFKINRLSIARAAALAGMHRFDFENKLADIKLPISNLEIKDAENEINKL